MSRLLRVETIREGVLALVLAEGFHGLTVAELRDKVSEHHHGTLSGHLSFLHRDEVIARLTEERDGCKVYVHRDFVDGRETEAQGWGRSKAEVDFAFAILEVVAEFMQPADPTVTGRSTRTKAARWPQPFERKLRETWEQHP